MWFKTRVSLVSVLELMEIRSTDYPDANPPYYAVFAEYTKDQSFDFKGMLGKGKARNHYTHLARFRISDAAPSAIAECMRLIEEAIRADTRICDLSAAGDSDAWSDAWMQIVWP